MSGWRHTDETRRKMREAWARRRTLEPLSGQPDIGRPVCAKPMPMARERCARTPGHRRECRTRYALDNAYRMATGRERVA